MYSRPWKWTNQRERAARLIAEDEKPDREIAGIIGVNPLTLWRWRASPEFMQRVEGFVSEYRARIRRSGIAVLENRIAKLADIQWRMDQVIAERAKAYGKPEIPGGSSGLVAMETKGIGSKGEFRIVEEYKVDAALLREYREFLKEGAQQLGQWSENKGDSAATDRLQELIEIARRGPAQSSETKE